MNKRNVLFIRPKDCRYCSNGFFGLGHTVDYAASKSFNISDLQQKMADNPYIDDTIKSFNPYMIYGNGHGNNSIFTANSETPVWVVGEDLTFLAGRIVYLLSCLTANQLGPYIINQGALGYGGFLISWTWMSEDISGDPYEDYYANCFYRSTNKFFESLLDGNTLQQAMIDSVAEYNYWIDYFTNEGEPEIVKWLIWDRDGLIILGDPNASTCNCSEFLIKQECIDSGCWWYEGSCHSENPGSPVATYDFTVKAMPSKAEITEWTSYDRIYTDYLDNLVRIKNIGKGEFPIWHKLINKETGAILYKLTDIIKPTLETKYHPRISAISSFTLRLEAGHKEGDVEVLDDFIEKPITYILTKYFGHNYATLSNHSYTIHGEVQDYLIGSKFTTTEAGKPVAIEAWSEYIVYLPDLYGRHAIYRVSDGKLIAQGKFKYIEVGGSAARQIFVDGLDLEPNTEYWLVMQIDAYDGAYAMYQNVRVPGMGAKMAWKFSDPLPETFIPVVDDRVFYMRCYYE